MPDQITTEDDPSAGDSTLEAPGKLEDLYLYRGEDVEWCRPLFTGDVVRGAFKSDNDHGLAIILTHPCSMRSDGVNLVDHLLCAPVVSYQKVSGGGWRGHFNVMPLPGLMAGSHFAARLDQLDRVSSSLIRRDERIACLSEIGVSLLQQRLVSHLTRFTVKRHLLWATMSAVMTEVDLMEEWCAAATDAGGALAEAEASFHVWIREAQSGPSRQDRLKTELDRASVRRELAHELATRWQT